MHNLLANPCTTPHAHQRAPPRAAPHFLNSFSKASRACQHAVQPGGGRAPVEAARGRGRRGGGDQGAARADQGLRPADRAGAENAPGHGGAEEPVRDQLRRLRWSSVPLKSLHTGSPHGKWTESDTCAFATRIQEETPRSLFILCFLPTTAPRFLQSVNLATQTLVVDFAEPADQSAGVLCRHAPRGAWRVQGGCSVPVYFHDRSVPVFAGRGASILKFRMSSKNDQHLFAFRNAISLKLDWDTAERGVVGYPSHTGWPPKI